MARILVVDDDAAILKLISAILGRAGHEVRTARHPLAALELMAHERPDLVISDVVMPYMTGYEFLSRLRADPHTAGLPLLLMSSHAERQDVRRGMNLGADDYIPKPFTADDVTDAVSVRLQRANGNGGEQGVEVRALGEATLQMQGSPVLDLPRKSLELLMFVVHRREVSSWEAAEALWPEKDESRASSLFHTTLHRLRKTLPAELIVNQSRRYTLNPELRLRYDVRLYQTRGAQALRGGDLAEVAEVTGLHAPFLPGIESEWCEEVRQELSTLQRGLLSRAALLSEQAGQPREAVRFYQQALSLDPFADDEWSELERTLRQLGDPRVSDAVRRVIWWD